MIDDQTLAKMNAAYNECARGPKNQAPHTVITNSKVLADLLFKDHPLYEKIRQDATILPNVHNIPADWLED